MGIPRFNFKREHEVRGSPVLPPWRKTHRDDLALIFYVGGGLLLGILLVLLVQKRLAAYRSRRRADPVWARLHQHCAARGLDAEEERLLTMVLRAAGVKNPEQAALSQNYFDSLAADDLARRIGRMGMEQVRRKLFRGGGKPRELSGVGGTHELATGQKVRLHFSGVVGTYACTVISNASRGFVVTLPTTGGGHLRPRKGDRVEGFIEIGSGLSSFESKVVETFRGGVFACRIAHATNLHKLHSRESPRVRLEREVVFGQISSREVDDERLNLGELEQRLHQRWHGTLRDLGSGGCCLSTPERENFDVGDFVQFRLRPLPDDPEHSFLGTVVHVEPIPYADGGGRVLHVQFLGLDESAEGTLTRAMHRLGREGDGG